MSEASVAVLPAQPWVEKDDLARLGRPSVLRSLGAVAWTWGWILGCFAFYCWRPGPLAFAAGWVIMSGRHLALAILMHEAAHRLIARDRRLNDWVGRWLLAYPILLDLEIYRSIHLQHHKATWTDADPDLHLAEPFPITRRSLWRKIVRDLTGQTGWDRYRLIARLSAGLSPKKKGLEGAGLFTVLARFARRQRGFLITNAVILAGLVAARHPEAFLLLWWLPAFTGYSLVLRLRSIAEHAAIGDPKDELRQTRTTLAPFWLRFFLAPHSVNYHLEHHLYMFVPHYRLARVHRLLEARGVLEHAEIATSYLAVLRKATSASEERGARRGSVLPFGA